MDYRGLLSRWQSPHGRFFGAAIVCLFLGSLAGCGRAGPEVVPVKGRITFGGGPWPKPGTVAFTAVLSPESAATRPAMGDFDTDGSLTVTTFKKGDGLAPGTYGIAINCWEVPPSMDSPTPPKSYVPSRYRSAATSGFTVTVEPGQREVRLNLDVPRTN